jgi:uncharacterized protein (TIGR03435 family)
MEMPVIDRTGIAGVFDIQLQFTVSPIATPGVPQDPPAGPSLFTALRTDARLVLQPGTGPIERLVVDNVQRLTAN